MSGIVSKFSRLNIFSKGKEDEENLGETIEPDTVAGGGKAARKSQIARHELRISHALKIFLVKNNVLPQSTGDLESDDASTVLRELLNKPHINVPRELTDRSYPLTEYFISSSHNTYLVANQLYGKASAVAYETALNTGSRCVEIDAWDNEDDENEPKVTHGYTLATHISFRKVCETIRDIVDEEAAEPELASGYRAAPILLSLENHTSAKGQMRLVEIMREVWGHRLISKPIRDKGKEEQEGQGGHVSLADLGSKIVLIVEYHLDEENESDDSGDEGVDEEVKQDRQNYKQKKKAAPKVSIIPELAELGVYAQSVKPADNSWFEAQMLQPHHHLINVSETGLGKLLPHNLTKISHHNSQHLMRVFPKGTRISSNNLNPVPFWGVGAQISALNWQTFDHSMQLNEALFTGSDGYVLKPAALRSGGSGKTDLGRKKKLRLHVAGATDIPVPPDRPFDEIRPYVTCTLLHPNDIHTDGPEKRKTAPYKQHKLGIVHKGEQPPPRDPFFDEVLEWEYEDNELVFLRILIKSDDKFAKNPVFAVTAVRLMYVTKDWVFVRLLDLKGRETRCTLLVKFEITDV